LVIKLHGKSSPYEISVLPNGEYIYVTTSAKVMVIRTDDNTVIDSVSAGMPPFGIAALPNSEYIYVTSIETHDVAIICTSDNTVVERIKIGYLPSYTAVHPNGEYVYVTGYWGIKVVGF